MGTNWLVVNGFKKWLHFKNEVGYFNLVTEDFVICHTVPMIVIDYAWTPLVLVKVHISCRSQTGSTSVTFLVVDRKCGSDSSYELVDFRSVLLGGQMTAGLILAPGIGPLVESKTHSQHWYTIKLSNPALSWMYRVVYVYWIGNNHETSTKMLPEQLVN